MARGKGKIKESKNIFITLGLTRIALGLTFLWAFFDKLLGLGFSTCRDADTDAVTMLCEKAWLEGGSPTSGFLQFAAKGPFSDLFGSMAQNTFVDTLFMFGMLGIGIGLTFGIAMKISTLSGALMMTMMYLAVIPPENHPLIDQHIIYILILATLYFADEKQQLGFRGPWLKSILAKKIPLLR